MKGPDTTSGDLARLEQDLRAFIAGELMAPGEAGTIAADDDLIKRGIVDSLGITQLVDFCESRYAIQVTDADLVPENFQSVRRLAEYVDRKRGERGNGRLPSSARSA
jgi:acyl carrier protein